MPNPRRKTSSLQEELIVLHALAGEPDDRQMEAYASIAGHRLSRSTANTIRNGRGSPRWETVEAFVAACTAYAEKRPRREIPSEYLDMALWQARYDGCRESALNARKRKAKDRTALTIRLPRSLPIPSRLLDPESGIIEFIGRVTELDALLGWCKDKAADRLRLLTGPGGIGKTRLALQLAKQLNGLGWRCEWVGDRQETHILSDIRAVDDGRLLLVVDYAETRIGLEEFIRAVAADAGLVRVLLLARSAGQWWEQLAAGEGAIRDLVVAAGSAGVSLGEILDEQVGDEDAIRKAVPVFAAAMGVAPPDYVEVATQARRARALELHAAALVAVLDWIDAPYQPPQVDLNGILGELLRHEERFWLGSARAQKLQDGPEGLTNPELRQVIATGCLLGAADQQEAVALLRRVPGVPASVKLAMWLRELYPPGCDSEDWLGVMQPDRLAERFIVGQLSESEALAKACLSELDQRQARRAILLLARAATEDSGAERLLRRLLPLAVKVVEDIDAPLETLVSIANAMPYPSVALGTAHSVIARRILAFPATNSHPAEHARWLTIRGLTLSQLGRPGEALTVVRQALDLYRQMASANSGRYLPNFASTLTSLGIIYSKLGRSGEALPVAEESVSIYRNLAAVNPSRYQISLAATLTKFGEHLAQLGRAAEALKVTEEAADLLETLASSNQDRYQAEIAFTLNHLGARLSEMGRSAEALTITLQAADRCRRLASANPDRHQLDLASTLAHLGARYSAMGHPAEAVMATLEATSLIRGLILVSPDQYRPEMAGYLASLGGQFRDLGRMDEALAAGQEAVSLYRELNAASPGSHQPELAAALTMLGNILAGQELRADALAAAQEAVSLYRHMAGMSSDKYLPHLSRCLTSLGARYSELGQVADALAAEEEAVSRYQELAVTDADRYQPDLALALMVLSARYSQLGHPSEALAAERSAANLYRQLASNDPARYQPNLALALLIIGAQLSRSSRSDDAVSPEREAVSLYRELAARNPGLYRIDLAASLTSLGFRLSDLGQPAEALTATQEAVMLYRELIAQVSQPEDIPPGFSTALGSGTGTGNPVLVAIHYRSLAAAYPDQYRPDLALSLIGLQARLSELSRPAEALATMREAVDLYRELAAGDPDWYRPNLALSIRILGAKLSELGRQGEALAAEEEAIDLYRELATTNPGYYRSGLAASLTSLGFRLSDLGQTAEALTATQEAVMLYREMTVEADADRPDIQPGFPAALWHRHSPGRPDRQLADAQDTATLYRTLAAVNPRQYKPVLAQALSAYSGHLSSAGNLRATLSIQQELVGLYEELVATDSDRYQSSLTMARTNCQQTLGILEGYPGVQMITAQ